MSNELDKQLADLVSAAKSAGSDAFAFIQQQAPDVIDQMIRWEITKGIMLAGAGLIAVFAAAATFRITHKYVSSDKSSWSNREMAWIPGALVIIACVVIAGQGVVGVMQATKAMTAPKLVVLEQVTRLVGK